MRHIAFIFLLLCSCKAVFSKDEYNASHSMPPLPAAIEFAGEQVPLHFFDIRESMERELALNAYWHSQTMMHIKLSNRYFPVIEPILRQRNIPDDFKYLCVAESGLQHVVSPAKAAGMWQIIPSTAKELGLEINDEVDERYNLERATHAACTFLQKAYEIYGTWTMAAAAYNMGTSGLSDQTQTQKTNYYYDLRLNTETARYLFRILAIKIILGSPAKYGFMIGKDELYPPYRYTEVVVGGSIASIADFAAEHGTNYKMLKMLNPWLRKPLLTNKERKEYRIKIMQHGYRENAYSP
jgi:hypothetical protein